jgi:osmotically inducible lipoprotein OsmB
MKSFSNLSRLAAGAALSAALILPATGALASQDGQNTLLGAGAGALAGGLLTHGSAGGIVGGAVVGGVAGHVLSRHHHHHYYRHHHRDDR